MLKLLKLIHNRMEILLTIQSHENLRELCDAVLENNADLGIAVDPDVR